uniref:Uncharacterized protein n=1 Tax=Alexandrium monilatum TaxID=311494 RepID=A0A7S4PTP7_9DINO
MAQVAARPWTLPQPEFAPLPPQWGTGGGLAAMNGPLRPSGLLRWHTGNNLRGNRVVQCKNQEREDPTLAMESSRRAEAERMARRALRLAEGGRCGGLNDRQEVIDKREWVDNSGYDDFGRRISKPAAGDAATGSAPSRDSTTAKELSREERRQAALERLRRKGSAAGPGAAGAAAPAGAAGSGLDAAASAGRSRSRSRPPGERPAPEQE